MWKIEWSKEAQKQLEKLDPQIKKKILKYLRETLKEWSDPRQRAEKLVEDKAGWWRFRVGDYRLIFEIEDHILIILIIKVGHRKEIYED
jgi:mRNA interferase RelE/StbE